MTNNTFLFPASRRDMMKLGIAAGAIAAGSLGARFAAAAEPEDGSFLAPDQYVLKAFERADIILLGEDHAIRQNLEFVRSLVPALYARGVRNLVMEFGAFEDQAALDQLVTAAHYDEARASALMFNYNSAWSWLEYRNLYRAAWAFNRTLPAGEAPFRIVNMSYVYNWRAFRMPRTPEVLRQVFWRGTIDKFRADLIQREILDRGQKALVLTGTPHAFSRYQSGRIDENSEGFCGFDGNWLGGRLLRSHGGRVTSLLFHQPFPQAAGAPQAWAQPAGGAVEALMRQGGGKPAGLDLRGQPAGQLPDRSQYAVCHPDFTLGDFFDGYIYLASLAELQPATPDPSFVDEYNIAEALAQFPDPDWQAPPKDLAGFHVHLQNMAVAIQRRYQQAA